MYIGVTYTNNGPYSSDVPAVASRSLENNTLFSITHNSVTTGTRLLVNVMARERYPIHYVFGFAAKSFSYLLTVQKVSMDSNTFQSKLVRVCQDDQHYYSYIEVPLVCKNNAAKIDYNLAQSAHIGKPGSELANLMVFCLIFNFFFNQLLIYFLSFFSPGYVVWISRNFSNNTKKTFLVSNSYVDY